MGLRDADAAAMDDAVDSIIRDRFKYQFSTASSLPCAAPVKRAVPSSSHSKLTTEERKVVSTNVRAYF